MLRKQIITNWLNYKDLNIFATVTLKKGTESIGSKDYITIHNIGKSEISRTAWILRDRVLKAVYGTRAFKSKKIPPFLVFNEIDNNNRPHFHIITSSPAKFTIAEYEDKFRSATHKIDWVYKEIDIQKINSDELLSVINYSLKTGFDAFLPEASFIPNSV